MHQEHVHFPLKLLSLKQERLLIYACRASKFSLPLKRKTWFVLHLFYFIQIGTHGSISHTHPNHRPGPVCTRVTSPVLTLQIARQSFAQVRFTFVSLSQTPVQFSLSSNSDTVFTLVTMFDNGPGCSRVIKLDIGAVSLYSNTSTQVHFSLSSQRKTLMNFHSKPSPVCTRILT